MQYDQDHDDYRFANLPSGPKEFVSKVACLLSMCVSSDSHHGTDLF